MSTQPLTGSITSVLFHVLGNWINVDCGSSGVSEEVCLRLIELNASTPFYGFCRLLWFCRTGEHIRLPQSTIEWAFPSYKHPAPTEKLALIKRWFTEGVDHNYDFFPRRVLDLSSSSGNTRSSLRLVDASQNDVRGQYVALSHRWGSIEDMFYTTASNIQSRKAAINFEDLPATFQDAVIITRSLGVRYLWIDALCIVQHDTQDWLGESSSMGMLYEHAACTISAHCASNDHDGFLYRVFRDPPTVRLPDIKNGQDTFSSYVSLPGHFHYQVNESLLSRRGWVLQERFCSRRILHCTTTQLFWEDEQGIKGEAGSLANSWDSLNKFGYEVKNIPRLTSPSLSIKDWYTIIEKYSTCDLTVPTDKLPAISGIARLMQPRIQGGQYFSGIWMRDIHRGLLWCSASPSDLRAPAFNRAATWSWALYDGPIAYDHRIWSTRSNITCQRAITLPDRTVQDVDWLEAPGELILSARLKPLGGLGEPAIEEYPWPTKARSRTLFATDEECSSDNDHGWVNDIGWVVLDQEHGLVDNPELASSFYLADIASDAHNFILLLSKIRDSPPTYIRIGMGCIWARPENDYKPHYFQGTAHTEIHLV
ncbi:heterokaryon incompatibility protein-domain-containing protein [Lophiotrema nucula]|uniref:Heterokaryon incompatibility protein-domain-containing protein n=1 Tax=Lophiotrema nucula TaxID=690887 RepID=A0A6A5ZUU9_9PLEO|nr:heterokaryon incompatibility protein-domain-containing protein [Lophiotrema nucula]